MSNFITGSGEATSVVPPQNSTPKTAKVKKRRGEEPKTIRNTQDQTALGALLKMLVVTRAPLESTKLTVSTASGIVASSKDGKPAQLAIVDSSGKILEVGEAVALEVWNLSVELYSEFLANTGIVKVQSHPPCLEVV